MGTWLKHLGVPVPCLFATSFAACHILKARSKYVLQLDGNLAVELLSSITNTVNLDCCDGLTQFWNCLLFANFSSITKNAPPSVQRSIRFPPSLSSAQGRGELERISSSQQRWAPPWTGHQSITWLAICTDHYFYTVPLINTLRKRDFKWVNFVLSFFKWQVTSV